MISAHKLTLVKAFLYPSQKRVIRIILLPDSFYHQIRSSARFILAPDSTHTDEIHSIARIWKCNAIEMQWPRIIDALYYHRVDWMEIQTGSKHCNCAEVIWNENTFHWRRCFFSLSMSVVPIVASVLIYIHAHIVVHIRTFQRHLKVIRYFFVWNIWFFITNVSIFLNDYQL